MKKDLLTLLGCSSSLAITLMSVSSVGANDLPVREYVFTADEGTEVLAVEQLQENLVSDNIDAGCGCQSTEVTDAEGDLAIATYGCDCAGCRFLVRDLVSNQSL